MTTVGAPQYEFTSTQDWFSFNTGIWSPFITQLRTNIDHPARALEIGSWEGRSAVYLLENLCNTPDSMLVCIDHFDLHRTAAGRERYEKIQRNLSIPGYPFRVVDEFSVPGLYQLLKEEIEKETGGFDFVYIDGSHEADDTFLDAELAWRLTRTDAIVIFDDYEWSTEDPESIHHPKRGIDGFLSLHLGEYEVLHRGYQVIIRKTGEMKIGFLTKKSPADIYADAPINIALCTDSAYAGPTAVAIISAIRATTDRRLSFYIVDCGLTENDREGLRSNLDPATERVTLNFIELPEESKGRKDPTWARIDALSRLPVERVLFLDSDILVRRNLAELWSLDLGEKLLAAARDVGFPMGHKGVTRGPYFNAGVLLVDLTRIRSRLSSLVEFVETKHQTTFRDQDALNDFFHGDWHELDVEWNATGLGTYAMKSDLDRTASWPNGELEGLYQTAKIVHFTGPVHPSLSRILDEYNQPWASKPWGFAGAPGHPFAREWHAMLRETAWKNWLESQEHLRECEEAKRAIIEQGLEVVQERVAAARAEMSYRSE
ncbi:hypothetical protein PQX77_014019 [Marasmius sp. AFHP31]|nr:hypothetical protein PQX77_014019 [Marasmius sp. AFHP31]